MNLWARRAAIFAFGCVLLVFLGTAWTYRTLWVRYDAALEQLQARSQRLDGLVAAGAQITEGLSAASATVSPWLHPAGENAANALQQGLRERIAASGNTQVSSQAALEPGVNGGFARVQASTTITGTWAGIIRLLQELQTTRPPYWVAAATLSRDGANTPNANQNARLVLQVQVPIVPEKAVP